MKQEDLAIIYISTRREDMLKMEKEIIAKLLLLDKTCDNCIFKMDKIRIKDDKLIKEECMFGRNFSNDNFNKVPKIRTCDNWGGLPRDKTRNS